MPTIVQKTIKASGGDYTSLANLEAANANLVALDEAWEVLVDNLEGTAAITFTGWVTSATCYLKIKAADAHGSTGKVTTNAARIVVAAGGALSMTGIGSGGLVIFDGIQFKASSGTSFLVSHSNNSVIAAKVRYINCVFEHVGTGIGLYLGGGATATNDAEIINCIFLCGGRCVQRDYRDLWLYGSTFISASADSNGAVHMGTDDGRTRVIKNCYAANNHVSNQAYGNITGATLVSAASNRTSGDIDNVLYTTANFTNVTAGSENLIPPVGSALLVAGMDRSLEVAPFDYTTDIAGNTRPIIGDDVGAFQVTAVAPSGPSAGVVMFGMM